MDVCRTMDKEPVEAQDSPGFISNRILCPMINEAIFALQEGIGTPEAIDTVMKLGMNHPMGPLTLCDLIGLDVVLFVMEVLQRDLGAPLQSGDQHLAARLQDLPLARVLPLYGCTVMTYLHARPLLAIEQEFRRCKACEATEHCEAALRQRAGTTAFSFCPNQVALEQFAAQCQR